MTTEIVERAAPEEPAKYLPTFISPGGEAKALGAYDAVLGNWTAPATELDVPTFFGHTHVIASGREDRPPLVLLHALLATAAVWYPNAGPLSEHFRVYAVDTIGDANKSRPTRPMTRLDDYARWFNELLDGLGVRATGLVGNSFGGFVGSYVAMALPQRVRRLVLIGPSATLHGILPFYLNMFLPKALYLFLPWLPGQERVMRYSIDWMHAGLPEDGAWARLFYQQLMYGAGTNRVFPKVWSKQELSRIEAPTLLLVGDRERIYRSAAVVRAARALMPTIETAIVPGAHHIAALAQPQAVNEHILRFCGSG
jgi:pimeloyl-ACP methyl ester carboxylesterase